MTATVLSVRTARSWRELTGVGAIAAALPTVVWRVVVGSGPTLGTPASWRRSEAIPGSGTGYVLGLSVVQLIAALLTVVLFVPGVDAVPRWSPVAAGRRLPAGLVAAVAGLGCAVLAALCVLSAVAWHNVDPFRDAASRTAWTYLCWACYLAALAWPVLLAATIVGYVRARADVHR